MEEILQNSIELEKPKRGRKKKEGCDTIPSTSLNKYTLRDERGLLTTIVYQFDKFGFVNWKKMINPDHIILNRVKLAKDGIDTTVLTKEEIEQKKQELPDDKLLATLPAFRELARIRGIIDVRHDVTHERDSVICRCTITWMPNYETGFQITSNTAVASASVRTVSPTYSVFLEAIASNRAFVRAVREYLNIFTVCEEEINANEEVELSPALKPNKFLAKICKEKKIEFATLVRFLNDHGIELNSDISTFEGVPDKIAVTALGLIKGDESELDV